MKADPAILYRVAPATVANIPVLTQTTNIRSVQRRLSLYSPDDDGSGLSSVVYLAIGGNSAPHLPQPSESGSGR